MYNQFLLLLRKSKKTYKISLKIYCLIKIKYVKFTKNTISVSNLKKEKILLSIDNITYVKEIVDNFEFYFDSVQKFDKKTLDFSSKNFHKLNNFSFNNSLLFSTVPTPSITSKLYIDITKPLDGEIVFDLGSYCGVTVIDYLLKVGTKGLVVGVEPDKTSFECLESNLEIFKKTFPGHNFHLENLAIAKTSGEVIFSNNADMSSAVKDISSILYQQKQNLIKINSINLTDLAIKLNIKKVDIIKADIEGSEVAAFSDSNFFKLYNPRIILEPITMKGKNSAEEIDKVLFSYGYKKESFKQAGSKVPLLLYSR